MQAVEIWKAIPGYEGYYEASSLGRIRSIDRTIRQVSRGGRMQERVMRGRVLKQAQRSDGYLAVVLSMENVRANHLVHQLVCEAFNGMRPPGQNHTRHLDGDRVNNAPANLRWGTPSENVQDTIRHGRHGQLAKTHCPQGHEYTPENTVIVKRADRAPGRECHRCQLARWSAYNAKRVKA